MRAPTQAAVPSLHFTFRRAPVARRSVAVVALFYPEPQSVSTNVGMKVDALAHGRTQTGAIKVADTMTTTCGAGLAICLAFGAVVVALAAVAIVAGEIPETNTLSTAIAEAVAAASTFPIAIAARVTSAIVVARARCAFDIARGSSIPRHHSLDPRGLLLERLRRMSHSAAPSDALAHITHRHTTGTIDFSFRHLPTLPARLNKASAGRFLRCWRTRTAVVCLHVSIVTLFIHPPFSVAIFGDASRIEEAVL